MWYTAVDLLDRVGHPRTLSTRVSFSACALHLFSRKKFLSGRIITRVTLQKPMGNEVVTNSAGRNNGSYNVGVGSENIAPHTDETSAYNRSSSSVRILIGSQLLNSLGIPTHPSIRSITSVAITDGPTAGIHSSLAFPPRRRRSIGKPNKIARMGHLNGNCICTTGLLRDRPPRAISFLAGTGGLSRGYCGAGLTLLAEHLPRLLARPPE